LIDGPYTELTFDSGNEWWSLKQSPRKSFHCIVEGANIV
jgi:hypothetical protein